MKAKNVPHLNGVWLRATSKLLEPELLHKCPEIVLLEALATLQKGGTSNLDPFFDKSREMQVWIILLHL